MIANDSEGYVVRAVSIVDSVFEGFNILKKFGLMASNEADIKLTLCPIQDLEPNELA